MTPVSELQGYLPHTGEMVWIDAVVDQETCLVIIDAKKHYADSQNVRQSSFIEWMAQGFGFASALAAKNNPETTPITNAFLVGFSNVLFASQLPVEGEALLITTVHKRTIGPINYIEGKVASRDSGVIYCEGQLKLFSN